MGSRLVRRMRRLVHAPRFAAGMDRVYQAADAGDWKQVVETLEALHGWDLVTPTSRHWLGLGYLQLHRWCDALDQYEKIRKPLPERDMDIRRVVNHAIACFELGERQQCARLLKEQISPDWPEKEVRRAKTMIAAIEGGEN